MKVKVFKCIYCENKYVDKQALYDHILEKHNDNIPKGMSVSQHLFNVRNKKSHGSCIICGKETKWNEKTEKYERICSEKCQKEFRNMFKNRMINTHGKVHLLDDPEQQKKMLANRSISGEYRWTDGTMKPYTGSYELDFLKVCDKMLGLTSNDVIIPAPMVFNYTDSEGKKRFYIPDAYIVSLNTIVEIKDGGSNPNKHHKIQDVDKAKEKMKDDIMRNQKQYNYVKVTDKNYAILLNFMLDLKDRDMEEGDVKLPLIRIDEAANLTRNKLLNKCPMVICEMTSGIIGDLEKLSLINENKVLNEVFQVDMDSDSNKIMKDSLPEITRERKFGIPDTKQFPLNTVEEVQSAIKNYMRSPRSKRRMLANAICKSAYEMGLSIGNGSLIWQYADWKPNETDNITVNDSELQKEFPNGFFSANIKDPKNDKGIWSSIHWVNGKPYRERVEVLIFKDLNTDNPKLFIAPPTKKYPNYRLPGGSTSLKRSLEYTAESECKEEARIVIKNPKLLYSTYDHNWSATYTLQSDKSRKIRYQGSYIHILVAEYNGKYGGIVEKCDEDKEMASKGRFVPLHSINLEERHSIALRNMESTKINEGNFEQAYEELKNQDEVDFENSQQAFFDLLQENFTIDSEGTMIIKLREKTNFMSKYNMSHRLLKIYYKTDNIEGIKSELAKLYYMYEIIEYYYVNGDRNGISKLQLMVLSKNKKEAIKAKSFIMNDFSTGLKFVLSKEKNFDFQDYFMKTDYYNDVIKLDTDKIKGIKKLLMSILA